MASVSDDDVATLDTLPEPALRLILPELPADQRALAACVCPSWRAFLADPSLFQVLDLTPAGGVAAARVTANLVRALVARAGGKLRVLRLSSGGPDLRHVHALLVPLIETDGAELEELSTDMHLSGEELEQIRAAAPRLRVLNANYFGGCTRLLPILRNSPLRAKELNVMFSNVAEPVVLAVAAAVASHESLHGMTVMDVNTRHGMSALLAAATERRVSRLMLSECVFNAECFGTLSQLLRCGSLTKLQVHDCAGFPPEPIVQYLCAALRACPTLTQLELGLLSQGGTTAEVVTELLDAVKTLPALSELTFFRCRFEDNAFVGRALGALLSANLPSLRILVVMDCQFGDEALAPILDGLAANTHLHELRCTGNNATVAFQRDRLAPALAALELAGLAA